MDLSVQKSLFLDTFDDSSTWAQIQPGEAAVILHPASFKN